MNMETHGSIYVPSSQPWKQPGEPFSKQFRDTQRRDSPSQISAETWRFEIG
jgi:hypothetical protein